MAGPDQPLQNVERGRNEAIHQHKTQRTREAVYTREPSDGQVIGLVHNGRQSWHRSPLEYVHAAWIARSHRERAISERAGRRAKNPGFKNQGLWSLCAPEPDVVVLTHRLVDVWIRGTQIIHGVAPGPATEHF